MNSGATSTKRSFAEPEMGLQRCGSQRFTVCVLLVLGVGTSPGGRSTPDKATSEPAN